MQEARRSAADLYARHANHLFRFCLNQLRNRSEAEDAVQTTFLQAFRALQRGTIPHIERAWLIAIAQNVCRTMQRSSSRRVEVDADADPELVAGNADVTHSLREEISELERALARIPANQRRALVLREWQGLRYREIAGVMGMSQTAVEMLAFRARKSLSQALDTKSSRARQALDAGGIFGAIRGLLAGGSAMHAVAGAGLAGLALAMSAATPVPVQHADGAVRQRTVAAHLVTTSLPALESPSVPDRPVGSKKPPVILRVRPAVEKSQPTSSSASSPSTAAPSPSSTAPPAPQPKPEPSAPIDLSPAPVSLPAAPPMPSVTVPALPPPPTVIVPPLPVSVPTLPLP